MATSPKKLGRKPAAKKQTRRTPTLRLSKAERDAKDLAQHIAISNTLNEKAFDKLLADTETIRKFWETPE